MLSRGSVRTLTMYHSIARQKLQAFFACVGTQAKIPVYKVLRLRYNTVCYNDYMLAKCRRAFRRAALRLSKTARLFCHMFIAMIVGQMIL